MLLDPRRQSARSRRGVASAELAICLPVLGLFSVIIVDFARVFYLYLTIANCGLNGAVYASGAVPGSNVYYDATLKDNQQTHYATSANITTYAGYDAANLGGKLKVSVGSVGSDSYGKYVDVTVTCQFKPIVDFMGLTPSMNLQRVFRTRIVQAYPNQVKTS